MLDIDTEIANKIMPDTEWNSIKVIKNGFKNFNNRKCT